jgi:hypothetical protein
MDVSRLLRTCSVFIYHRDHVTQIACSGGAVAAAKAMAPKVKVLHYNLWARYDHGFQATPWPMAERLGLADVPSYYGVENALEVLAQAVRAERQAVGAGTELVPWLTPGYTSDTGGPHTNDPGIALFNQLIQLFANGATGFSMYPSLGIYDMSLVSSFLHTGGDRHLGG